jgi:hypothetical protein
VTIYQSTITFYIGLASITSSYLSDVVVDASPKDGKTRKKSLPSSHVTKQQFRVFVPFAVGGAGGEVPLEPVFF